MSVQAMKSPREKYVCMSVCNTVMLFHLFGKNILPTLAPSLCSRQNKEGFKMA